MKEGERTVLGYLAAFTLGVVCMGVIALVLMRTRHTTPEPATPAPSQAPTEDVISPPPAEPRRQTFQRIPRSIAPPVVEAPPAEDPATTASPPSENVEKEPPQVVVVPVAQPTPVRSETPAFYRDGGRLSGKVTFSGEPPPEKKINFLSDPYCSAQAEKGLAPTTTRLYVQGKDRALADVVVSLVGVSRKAGSYQRNVIVEQACVFEPYISAASVGQKILVQNRDRALHSPRLESKDNGEMHRTLLPGSSSSFVFELKAPEDFIRIRCDVHPWEFAYVSAFDHPFFAVTDKNGDFVIDGIPSGRYTVRAHHRKAGVVAKEVAIEWHHNTDVQFVIEIPPTQTAGLQ
jgi:hypothetical protein